MENKDGERIAVLQAKQTNKNKEGEEKLKKGCGKTVMKGMEK